jgi:hypothetical protein
MFRAALIAAGVLLAGSARAAEPAPTYALSWVRAEGAEECPSGRVLMAEVERRLGRPVFDAAAARAFEIEVTRFNGTYRSDVFVRAADGRALGHRTLQSDEPGCEALLSATALAIALLIDPEAAAREAPPANGSAVFEPAPPPPTPPPAPPPPVDSPQARPPAPIAIAPPKAVTETSAISLRGELTGGLVPAASPGVELAFGARPWSRWGFALAAAYTAPREAARGIGALDLSLTRAAALLTFEAARSSSARLVLGVGPTVGALHVAVRQPAPVTDPGDYWFSAAQGMLSLQLSATRQVFVELGASGFVALVRQQFQVRGQAEPVFRQPPVSASGFVGAGVRLP